MPEPLLGFGLNRKVVLEHHLTYNHYPPVDLRWVSVAEAAIDLAVSKCEVSDDGNAYCDVPELDDQIGQGKTAREVLDGLHLWDFVTAALLPSDDEYTDEPKAGE
jgi:hypothetical protein